MSSGPRCLPVAPVDGRADGYHAGTGTSRVVQRIAGSWRLEPGACLMSKRATPCGFVVRLAQPAHGSPFPLHGSDLR